MSSSTNAARGARGGYPDGGRVLVGRNAEVTRAIADFLVTTDGARGSDTSGAAGTEHGRPRPNR